MPHRALARALRTMATQQLIVFYTEPVVLTRNKQKALSLIPKTSVCVSECTVVCLDDVTDTDLLREHLRSRSGPITLTLVLLDPLGNLETKFQSALKSKPAAFLQQVRVSLSIQEPPFRFDLPPTCLTSLLPSTFLEQLQEMALQAA